MLHRVGISFDHKELGRIKNLQKRFRIPNRSEFFQELVKRYEKLENEFNSLNQCLSGYLKHPESTEETRAILKTTLKNQSPEEW